MKLWSEAGLFGYRCHLFGDLVPNRAQAAGAEHQAADLLQVRFHGAARSLKRSGQTVAKFRGNTTDGAISHNETILAGITD
jgi:hypothetical protein